MSDTITSYWWTGTQNFGDALAPALLEHFLKCKVELADPWVAQVLSTGSILHQLPQAGAYTGVIAGSGAISADVDTNLTNAKVLGLRGPLTAKQVKLTPHDQANLVLGDPALLASEIAPAERNKYGIGVVPHWTDVDLWPREKAKYESWGWTDAVLIDVSEDPLAVVSMIGSCTRVVTSSLHGMIVADSFSIPRRAEMYPAMHADPRYESDFKWNDYSESIGMPIRWGVAQEAPTAKIDAIKVSLFEEFGELLHVLSS